MLVRITVVFVLCLLSCVFSIEKANDENFSSLLENEKVLVVKYSANWCPHCTSSKPAYEKAIKELADSNPDVKMVTLDVEKSRKTADKEKINELPKMILYKKGEGKKIFDGNMENADEIVEWVESQL